MPSCKRCNIPNDKIRHEKYGSPLAGSYVSVCYAKRPLWTVSFASDTTTETHQSKSKTKKKNSRKIHDSVVGWICPHLEKLKCKNSVTLEKTVTWYSFYRSEVLCYDSSVPQNCLVTNTSCPTMQHLMIHCVQATGTKIYGVMRLTKYFFKTCCFFIFFGASLIFTCCHPHLCRAGKMSGSNGAGDSCYLAIGKFCVQRLFRFYFARTDICEGAIFIGARKKIEENSLQHSKIFFLPIFGPQ